MFHWYQKAQMCYVYLSDVSPGLEVSDHQLIGSEFGESRWWTRGWTLQELIAPPTVVFYDREWNEIGTKRYLGKLISSITGIALPHLIKYWVASVAQKMSWAAKRKTTGVEDRAYSLMGLFGVHMPPLYGEGWKAFRRLQLEILSSSDDESLFAWMENTNRVEAPSVLLAETPESLSNSGNIVRSKTDADRYRVPFAMTNKGLRVEFFLVPGHRQAVLRASVL